MGNLITTDITPRDFIECRYDKAKLICGCMWHNPDDFYFEDIFHDTIYNCLVKLDDVKTDPNILKAYFFKAFRINMIRNYGYAYNKNKSGIDVADVIIPVEYDFEGHMDGFDMMDLVKSKYGDETHEMLWDNLKGYTYKELNDKYSVNSFYNLAKVKRYLKDYYGKGSC